MKIKGQHYSRMSAWAKVNLSECTGEFKVVLLMRFHWAHVFDQNGAVHERAMRRLRNTKTWRDLVESRRHATSVREGERLIRLGY